MRKVGFVGIVAKRKSYSRSSFNCTLDGCRHSSGVQYADGSIAPVIDTTYHDIGPALFFKYKVPGYLDAIRRCTGTFEGPHAVKDGCFFQAKRFTYGYSVTHAR